MGIMTIKDNEGQYHDITIEGPDDTPTDEELQTITEFFFPEQADVTEDVTEDVTKGSVDYISGVRNQSLRHNVAGAENAAEQRLQLLKLGLPEDSISSDDGGELLLELGKIPEDIRQRYDIKAAPGSTHIAIDEKGFSRYDVVDFLGTSGRPLLYGTAASLALAAGATAGAIPLMVGMGVVGAAGAVGYVLDEALEVAAGTRSQTLGENAEGLLYSFLENALPEGAGILISRGLGSLMKGSSSTRANEIRANARRLVKLGAKPDVAELTGNSQRLLMRGQAMAETITGPGFDAREVNAEVVDKMWKEFPVSFRKQNPNATGSEVEGATNKFMDLLRASMANPNELTLVNQNLKAVGDKVDKNLTESLQVFRKETDPQLIADAMELAVGTSSDYSRALFAKANNALGDDAIVPTRLLRKGLMHVRKETKYTGNLVVDSKLGKVILGLDDEVSVEAISQIRTALGEAASDPRVLGTKSGYLLRYLKDKADESMSLAESLQDAALNVNSKDTVALGRKEGFKLLREANENYAKREEILGTLAAKALKHGAENQVHLADPNDVLDLIVKNGKPTYLSDYLAAVKLPDSPPRTPKSYLDLVKDPKHRNLIKLTPDGEVAQIYKAKYEKMQEFDARVVAARDKGEGYHDVVRGALASAWMRRATDQFGGVLNVESKVDPLKLLDKIKGLGQTAKVLFGRDYESVVGALKGLSITVDASSGKFLQEVLESKLPVAEMVKEFQELTTKQKELTGETINLFRGNLTKAVESGEADKVMGMVMVNTDTIRMAGKVLGAKSPAMEDVKDRALAKLISSIGDPISSTVRTMDASGVYQESLSPDFIKAVTDGKMAKEVKKAITNFGRDKATALWGKKFVANADNLAKDIAQLSGKEAQGKAALTAAAMAKSLMFGAMFFQPLATAGTYGGLKALAAVLRSPWYYKVATRPARKLGYRLGPDAQLREAQRMVDDGIVEPTKTGLAESIRSLMDLEDVFGAGWSNLIRSGSYGQQSVMSEQLREAEERKLRGASPMS